MNKWHIPVQKLVALLMGVFLSLVVSLPVLAIPFVDNKDGTGTLNKGTTEAKTYKICLHCNNPLVGAEPVCKMLGTWKVAGTGAPGFYDGKPCVCSCSCVSGDTLITMADGSQKRADQLADGDIVAIMGLNGFRTATIYLVTKSVVTNYLAHQAKFSDGTVLTASENHTLLNEDEKFVPLESLSAGDKIQRSDGKLISLISTELVKRDKLELINIIINVDSELASDHTYFTNDLISGTWLLQTTRDSRNEPIELWEGTVDISNIPQRDSSDN